MKIGDTVILRDWVDVPRLRRCKINDVDAEALRKHKGTYVVISTGDTSCGYFEGPWVRLVLPNSSMAVSVKRCYFEQWPAGLNP